MKIYLMLNHVLLDEDSGLHIKGWWYSIDVEGTLGWTHPWVLGFWVSLAHQSIIDVLATTFTRWINVGECMSWRVLIVG